MGFAWVSLQLLMNFIVLHELSWNSAMLYVVMAVVCSGSIALLRFAYSIGSASSGLIVLTLNIHHRRIEKLSEFVETFVTSSLSLAASLVCFEDPFAVAVLRVTAVVGLGGCTDGASISFTGMLVMSALGYRIYKVDMSDFSGLMENPRKYWIQMFFLLFWHLAWTSIVSSIQSDAAEKVAMEAQNKNIWLFVWSCYHA
jgi:hypothetical protein